MKFLIVAVLIIIMFITNTACASSNLVCSRSEDIVTCLDEEAIHNKSFIGTVVKVLIIPVAKSVAEATIKEIIMKKYYETYGTYPTSIILKSN